MWELYALWTWIPLFVLRSASADRLGSVAPVMLFVTMGLFGLAGCLLGGWAADRFGRSQAAVAALGVSGTCCLLSPLAFLAPAPVLAAFCAVWGLSSAPPVPRTPGRP